MRENKAIAATDISVKSRKIGGLQIIIMIKRKYEIEHRIYSKDWKVNISKVAEAIVLLDLIEMVAKRTKKINQGILVIYCDNKKLYQSINREMDIIS